MSKIKSIFILLLISLTQFSFAKDNLRLKVGHRYKIAQYTTDFVTTVVITNISNYGKTDHPFIALWIWKKGPRKGLVETWQYTENGVWLSNGEHSSVDLVERVSK